MQKKIEKYFKIIRKLKIVTRCLLNVKRKKKKKKKRNNTFKKHLNY